MQAYATRVCNYSVAARLFWGEVMLFCKGDWMPRPDLAQRVTS